MLLLLLIFICQLCQQHLNPPFKKRGESWVKIVKLHPPPLAEVEWLEANYGEDQRETGLAPRKGETGGKRYLGTAWHGSARLGCGASRLDETWKNPQKSEGLIWMGKSWENHGTIHYKWWFVNRLWLRKSKHLLRWISQLIGLPFRRC